MKVNFYQEIEDKSKLKYVVIVSQYNDSWLFVRQKSKSTWEIPGGHIEPNELHYEAAKRELIEETGAVDFELKEICVYSVEIENEETFGYLYYSKIDKLGELPDFEIGEIQLMNNIPINLTYPEILPYLFRKVLEYLRGEDAR